MTLGEFAGNVYLYCRVFNGSVTSWIRTPERNKAVGGALDGAHPYGLGADVVYHANPQHSAEVFKKTAPALTRAQTRAHALGLEIIRESDHDHVQPRRWASPPQ